MILFRGTKAHKKKLFVLCLSAFFVAALAAPAMAASPAEDFKAGLAAHQAGDYTTALKKWRPLAEQGNSLAQYKLGDMYYNGRGVARDYQKAMYWYGKAANQGDAEAQISLGIMYEEGRGVTKDFVRAYMWYTLAIGQGYGAVVKVRSGLIRQMTSSQIEEAERLTEKWEPKKNKK